MRGHVGGGEEVFFRQDFNLSEYSIDQKETEMPLCQNRLRAALLPGESRKVKVRGNEGLEEFWREIAVLESVGSFAV